MKASDWVEFDGKPGTSGTDIVCTLVAVALAAAVFVLIGLVAFRTVEAEAAVRPPPPPDPVPTAPYQGWTQVGAGVTFVAYDIDVPAVNAATGEVVPGVYFHCHVPARWHGRPNRWGRMTCVLVGP